eukprot:2019545-Pleurochrysis_carterae.AAC.3
MSPPRHPPQTKFNDVSACYLFTLADEFAQQPHVLVDWKVLNPEQATVRMAFLARDRDMPTKAWMLACVITVLPGGRGVPARGAL